MILTFQAVSEYTGKSLSTVYRAVKTGKLSASTREDGTQGIEVSEVARIWPLINQPENANAKRDTMPGHENAVISILREKIAFLETEIRVGREREEKLMSLVAALQQRLLPAPVRPWWMVWKRAA